MQLYDYFLFPLYKSITARLGNCGHTYLQSRRPYVWGVPTVLNTILSVCPLNESLNLRRPFVLYIQNAFLEENKKHQSKMAQL